MDPLQRIAALYENLKSTVKNKNATERLPQLKKDIQNLSAELVVLGKENQEQFVKSIAMEGFLALLTAKNVPLTVVEKKNILQNAFDKLKPFALKEHCLFIFLRIQNLLCHFLIQVDQTILAREILENMEDLYDKINQCEPDKFIDAEDLFNTESVAELKPVNPDKIDKVITSNILMQAFLYSKLNLTNKYALYHHTALRRQLEMKEGTPKDWAVRVARLGNYFTYLNQMGNARHHLCAAYYVLRTYHDNCRLLASEFPPRSTSFEYDFQELSHHWVKYGLTLFKLSKKALLSKFFTKSIKDDPWRAVDVLQDKMDPLDNKDDDLSKDVSHEKEDYFNEKSFIFPTLDLKEMEARVPVDLVKKSDEAHRLFSFTYKWLKRTKQYYDFENHSAEHIACSLQLAELYEHLAFFEKDVDKQYIIQKKRADVLEALSALLKSCENMMNVQIDVIRELSQVQLELMALNLQKLWKEESQVNMSNLDNDSLTANSFCDSQSVRTMDTPIGPLPSKNMFMKKMEAAEAINGRLFRLSGQLSMNSPSPVSFNVDN